MKIKKVASPARTYERLFAEVESVLEAMGFQYAGAFSAFDGDKRVGTIVDLFINDRDSTFIQYREVGDTLPIEFNLSSRFFDAKELHDRYYLHEEMNAHDKLPPIYAQHLNDRNNKRPGALVMPVSLIALIAWWQKGPQDDHHLSQRNPLRHLARKVADGEVSATQIPHELAVLKETVNVTSEMKTQTLESVLDSPVELPADEIYTTTFVVAESYRIAGDWPKAIKVMLDAASRLDARNEPGSLRSAANMYAACRVMFPESNVFSDVLAGILLSEGLCWERLANLGVGKRGDLLRAISCYEQARTASRSAPDRGESLLCEARVRRQVASIGVDTEVNLRAAIEFSSQAVFCFPADSTKVGQCKVIEANATQGLADLGIDKRRNLQKAIELCQQALVCLTPNSIEAGECHLIEAVMHDRLARLDINPEENLREAYTFCLKASSCFKSVSLSMVACYSMQADLLHRRGFLKQGYEMIAKAIKVIEILQSQFQSESARRDLRERFWESYSLAVALTLDLAMNEEKAEDSESLRWKAWELIQRYKAVTLQASFAASKGMGIQYDSALAANFEMALSALSRIERSVDLNAGDNTQNIKWAESRANTVWRYLEGVVAQKRASDQPRTFHTITPSREIVAASLMKLVAPRRPAIVVEFFQADYGKLGVFAHPAGEARGLRLPLWLEGGCNRAAELARDSYAACEVLKREADRSARWGTVGVPSLLPEEYSKARETLETVGRNLGEMLAPLRNLITQEHWENATLILCPSRMLHALPLAAAHWGGSVTLSTEAPSVTMEIPRTLIDAHSIINLPTAALAVEVAQGQRPIARTAYVAAADPLGLLTYVYSEAAAVKEILEKNGFAVSCFVGEHATARTLWEHGPEAGIIHLAMHSGMSNIFDLCGVEFHDRRLLVLELLAWLHFNRAALAVVSTCSSAEPFAVTADDPSVLTRAWMLAGSTSVIGTLWPLADEPAKIFAQQLYHHWAFDGSCLADAMRLAMLDVRERVMGDIYDWAPFVLVGSGAIQLGEAKGN